MGRWNLHYELIQTKRIIPIRRQNLCLSCKGPWESSHRCTGKMINMPVRNKDPKIHFKELAQLRQTSTIDSYILEFQVEDPTWHSKVPKFAPKPVVEVKKLSKEPTTHHDNYVCVPKDTAINNGSFVETQAKIWIEQVLEKRFRDEDAIVDLLVDGEVLFKASKIISELMRRRFRANIDSLDTLPNAIAFAKHGGKYLPYSNVDAFLKVYQELGLTGIDLFSPPNVEKRGTQRVCLCIRAFSKKCFFRIYMCLILISSLMAYPSLQTW